MSRPAASAAPEPSPPCREEGGGGRALYVQVSIYSRVVWARRGRKKKKERGEESGGPGGPDRFLEGPRGQHLTLVSRSKKEREGKREMERFVD